LDLSQATQLLTWLDEEHRKDKAQLMAQQSQIEAQKAQLTEQARQLQEVQAVLARIDGQLPRLGQLEASIQAVRTEFAGLLAKHAAEQEVRDETRTRSERVEAETMARIVRQLQERVEGLGSFDNTVSVLRDEDSKLRSEITRAFGQSQELIKRLDAHDESLGLLAKDTQAFRDTFASARQGHEDLISRHLELKASAEALGSRFETKFEQMQSSLADLEKRQAGDINAMQMQQQEWDREIEDIRNELLAAQPPMARWAKQLEDFAAQFERNRKTLYDLHELEKQVRQQGNEVLELQRLSAERQRAEMREWQDSQTRVDEGQTTRLEQLEAWQRKMKSITEALDQRLEENKREVEARAAELGHVWAQFVQGQEKLLQDLKPRRKS
jgi:chromosome segregation ATPase